MGDVNLLQRTQYIDDRQPKYPREFVCHVQIEQTVAKKKTKIFTFYVQFFVTYTE